MKRVAEYNNNNNNNNRICIARVCRMTSEALDGQLQSCYAARARPKNTFKTSKCRSPRALTSTQLCSNFHTPQSTSRLRYRWCADRVRSIFVGTKHSRLADFLVQIFLGNGSWYRCIIRLTCNEYRQHVLAKKKTKHRMKWTRSF